MNRGFSGGRRVYGPKQKADPETLKRLFSFIFGDKKLIFSMIIVFIIISSVTGVLGSLFLKVLVDSYIEPILKGNMIGFSKLIRALSTMAVIYLIGVISTYTFNRIMVVLSQKVIKDLRDSMFKHMQTLPIRYFDTNSHGDIMSYYTNDTDTLRQLISQSIPQMFSSFITVVAVAVAMIYTSWELSIFVFISVSIMIFVTKKIAGKSGSYFGKQQQSIGQLNGFIEEMINGQKVVKIFCRENQTKSEFNEKNDILCHHSTKANTYANILMPIMANLGTLQYVILAIVGAIFAINKVGSLTLGGIVAFLQLSRSFTMPLNQLSQQLNAVVMALAGAKRVFNLLDEKSEEDNGYVSLVNVNINNGVFEENENYTGTWAWKHPHKDGTITYTELKGEICFYNVDFSYNSEKTILHDISLIAEPGHKIAFVGSTGAGKTTITNLINRFYDIADGKIRYDGININKIKKADLRHSLGIVLQDTNLFTGTVKENIKYGKLDATDEEVVEAAKLSNAHEFILRLPEGYETLITANGNSLSQGQRQLISIARDAIANPPAMILDEATSSIDTRTEAIVQKGMDQLMKGRTVFVIAHRLSTVKNSDKIMVLESGKIIESGNHQELINLKGKYYELYTGAFHME